MIGRRESELERKLRNLRAPDEAAAEERSWPVVREAYASRTTIRPTRRTRQLALAAAGGLAVIAVGLSPAGAKVGDVVSDVVGISDENAKPELRSLPAAGEVLTETGAGTWIVRDDGSKRFIGEYSNAAWSPNGRYVAAADGASLVVLDPEGNTEWSLPTEGEPSHIAWEGSIDDTRIAYVAGGDLYVVGGSGLGNRLVAGDVNGGPLWLELSGVSKVDPSVGGFPYVLAFRERTGQLRVVAPDSGGDATLAGVSERRSVRRGLADETSVSPVDGQTAEVRERAGRSVLTVGEDGSRRVVFTGLGRVTRPVWSPDGRWLLFGWREADQWVLLQPDRPRNVTGILDISAKFDSEALGGFPRPRSWVLPDR